MPVNIDINFVPNGASIRAFLKELERALNALGVDTSAFGADDLADMFDNAIVYADKYDEKISDIEKALEQLNKTTKEGKDKFADMFKFDAIGKAGEFIGGISEKLQESAKELRLFGVRAGVTGQDLEELGESAKDIYVDSRAFDSFKDASEAISIAKRELKDFLEPEELETFVTKAKQIGDTWGRDRTEVREKSAPAIKNFGITSGEAAGDFLALLQQNGAEDSLDSLNEYSQLAVGIFGKGEEGAAQFYGTIIEGAKAGARDSDKLVDALKEAQIRINDGNASKALSGIGEPIARQIEEVVKLGEAGTISVADVVKQTSQQIQGAFEAGDITDAMRQQLEVAVAGTPAEDLGSDLYTRIFSADINTADIQAQAAAAGASLTNAFSVDPFTQIERAASAAFASIGGAIAPILAPASSLLTTTAQLGPSLSFLGDFGKYAKAAGDFGKAILSKVIPSLFTEVAAKEAGTTAQLQFNAAALLNPYLLGAAVLIGAAVAAFALLRDTQISATEATENLNRSSQQLTEAVDNEKTINKTTKSLRKLADGYEELSKKTDVDSQKKLAELANEINARVPGAVTNIDKLDESGRKIGTTYVVATDEVRKFADEQDRLAALAKGDALKQQNEDLEAAVDAYDRQKKKIAEAIEEREHLQELVDSGEGDSIGGTSSLFDLDKVSTNLSQAKDEVRGLREEENKLTEEINKQIRARIEQGESIEDIAKATGANIDDIRYLSAEYLNAKSAAAEIGGEVKKQGDDIAKATGEVKKYGAAYDEALKNSSDFSSVSVSALAQSLANLDAARKTGNAERIAILEAQVKTYTDVARDAVASEAKLGSYLKQAELLSGKVVKATKTSTTREKSIVRIGDTVKDLIKELNNEITLSSLTDELEIELEEITQKQNGELEKLQKQYDDFQKKIGDSKKKGATFTVADEEELSKLQENGEVYNKIAEKFNIEREEKTFEFFRKRLEEQQKLQNEDINRTIVAIEDEANRISTTTEVGLKKRESLLIKSALLRETIERSSIVNNNEEYVRIFAERAKIERDIRLSRTEEERKISEQEATRLDRSLIEQEQKIFDTANSIIELRRLESTRREATTEEEREESTKQITIIEERLDSIGKAELRSGDELATALLSAKDREEQIRKQLAEFRYAEQVERVRVINEREEGELKRHNESVLRLVGVLTTVASERGGELIAKRESDALDALETMRARDLLTEEQYEKRKVELTKAAESERAGLEARNTGATLEAERQAQLEELKSQYVGISRLYTEAVDAGDVDAQKKLGDQLDGIEETIREKGSLITGVAGELQGSMTELFSNLFTGDEDSVKKPFKKIFLTLVGALQRLASAKITEVLIGSISGVLGLPGLVASFALRPAIEGIIGGLLTPLFDNLASFGEGSPALTTPQIAIVGDATVPERVLRDDQLRQIISESSLVGNSLLVPYLEKLISLFSEYPTKIHISRRDVYDGYNRYAQEENSHRVG